MSKDFYQILSIAKTASATEIKAAYRKAAIKYHPDKNQGDSEAEKMFKDASEAFEVLSNPQKKAVYDQYGYEGLSGQQGFSNVDDIFQNFGSIFDDFFSFGNTASGNSRRQRAQYGADLKSQLKITFAESIFGVKKDVHFTKNTACTACDQTGCEPGTSKSTCGTCGGQGQVRRSQGFFSIATTCPDCRGLGQSIDSPCKECRGTTRAKEKKTIEVDIPGGIENGMQLKLANKGDDGVHGGPAGDLYIQILVSEDKNYERDENDILSPLKISMTQAALGATIETQTLDGRETVEIPAGAQHDQSIKITGKGSPNLYKKTRGDFYFVIKIDIPKKLTSEQKDLLVQLSQSMGEENIGSKKSGGFFKNIFE